MPEKKNQVPAFLVFPCTDQICIRFRLSVIVFSVASVLHGHQGQGEVSHAMVLDTYDQENDILIFKNTYDDPESGKSKQFKVRRTDPNAPEELYFVHIEIKNMFFLPGQKMRHAIKWATRKAKKTRRQFSALSCSR